MQIIPEKYKHLLNKLGNGFNHSFQSFDTETTGLEPWNGDRIFAFSLGYTNGKTKVFRIDSKGHQQREGRKVLKDFFADTSIRKIIHNSKFDLLMVHMEGIEIPTDTKLYDTMIMSRLLRNLAPAHSLDFLCWEIGGYPRTIDKQMKVLGEEYGGYQNIPIHLMNKYQHCDAERCTILNHIFLPSILNDELLYRDFINEMQLILTTLRIETTGLKIDIGRCMELISWLESELDDVLESVYDLFGEYINLGSSEQLIRLLFKRLKFPVIEIKPDTKIPVTDKNVIAKLKESHPHPIHDLILRHRSYTKGVSMIKSYIEASDKDYIIHPTINTNKARTGRQSAQNPPLQTVSKKAALLNPFPVPCRQVFIPDDNDYVFFLVDYSGIEMRIIILQSQEEELIHVVNNNGDVHSLASDVLFGDVFTKCSDEKFKKVLRGAGKNTNFSIPYGAGPKKIIKVAGMEQLGIPLDIFLENFKEYQNRWPNIAFFTKNVIGIVKEQGYVSTPFGRKLYVPRHKLFAGANYWIQGTAAGVLKRAQVKVDHYLRDVWNDEIKIALPIHDELILKFPKKLLAYKNKILTEISLIMVDMPDIKIRLDVEWKFSKGSWDAAKEIKIVYT